MNKRGISPIIAIILLLMMTVAVAGAAFFWLSRIQNQLQGGVESFQGTIFTQVASSVDVLDADCSNTNCDNLTIIFHNTGNTKIPVDDGSEPPTTTWLLKDANQVPICSTNWNGTSPNVDCLDGCSTNPPVSIEAGTIHTVTLDLDGSDCDIGSYGGGEVFSFTVDFSGKTTSSGSFIKPSS